MAFARIFSAPLSLGRSMSLATRTSAPADGVNRQQYDKLTASHDRLNSHLYNVMQERDQEHEKVVTLSGLRSVPEWKRMRFVLADIITGSDRARNELIINRGREDGLAKGQFVLGNNSVIGTISDLSPTRAKIKLITDTTSRIPVTLTRQDGSKLISVTEGLMHGAGNGSAKIPLVPMKTDIKTGDLIYARKQPGFLDVPVIAGKLVQCKRDIGNPLLWDISIKPLCDFERLTDVAVIVMKE